MGIMAQSCPVQIHYETRTTRTPAFWDTPRRPMITHTNDSHQTLSQNKTKSKLQILKKLPKIQILQETLHATNLLKLFDKMYKYEMDPTRTVGATERTRDAGRTQDGRRTDGRMDRRMEWIQYTPQQLCCAGGYNEENFSKHASNTKWSTFQPKIHTHWKP